MHEEFEQWGMRISVAKTKVLVARAVPGDSPALSFQLDEQPLGTVQVFRYLRSVFTADNRQISRAQFNLLLGLSASFRKLGSGRVPSACG